MGEHAVDVTELHLLGDLERDLLALGDEVAEPNASHFSLQEGV
jgi:hypothetical protein